MDFPMLKDFNVDRFVVHEESLSERGISADDLVLDVEIVDNARFAEIF